MDKDDRDYSNGEITVHWKPAECVHSTICYAKLRSVFDPVKRPWVNMKGASTDKIIAIVNECPTDALTFSWDDKKKQEESTEEIAKTEEKVSTTKVQIMENGPAIISGDFTLIGKRGVKLAQADTIALCRCGHSSNQPFCDGTHNRVGYKENE